MELHIDVCMYIFTMKGTSLSWKYKILKSKPWLENKRFSLTWRSIEWINALVNNAYCIHIIFLYNCLTINKNGMLQILIQDMNALPMQKNIQSDT